MRRNDNKYKQGATREYVPQVWDNREDDEPIKVQLRTPTQAIRHKLDRRMYSAVDFAGILEKNPELSKTFESGDEEAINKALLEVPEVQSAAVSGLTDAAWQDHACELCVVAISDYWESGVEVKTAAELLEFGGRPLIEELALEIYGEHSLTDEEKKTSEQPSEDKSELGEIPRGGISTPQPVSSSSIMVG